MTPTQPQGVPCAYCGGRHAGAAGVRACWERAERAGATEPERADGTSATSPSATSPPATSPRRRAGGGRRSEGHPTGALAWGERALELGPVLGRSLLVAPGADLPAAWAGCERSGGSTGELEAAWRERVPLVVATDEEPPPPSGTGEVEDRPVWSLPASFAFPGERRGLALFGNAVDARQPAPGWRLGEAACALGARWGGPGDVVLPDGTFALLDGGPLGWTGPVGGAVVVPAAAVASGSLAGFGPNETDAELAPDQLAAVTHPGGAARIVAPAGSGKTRVLTERARHLLRRWRLPGQAVTLVAFNKRAADEMAARTPDLPELRVRTLNALGLSIVGRSAPVTTIDEHEVRALLDTLVDLPRRANSDPAAAWLEALSAVRLGLRDPAEVEAELGGDVDGLAEVVDRYRALLAGRGLVDFDEQVYRALEVLLRDPAARAAARASCRVLLVDEFQDLTPAHLLLVRLLAGPEGAVFGVGDDDQTIYGYSGASPEWLLDYRRLFPTAGEHPLEVNYRCPPAVVGAARTLLTHNRRRVDKAIVAAPGRDEEAGALEVVAPGGLGATVGVVARLLDNGAAPSEVAVLTRVNVSLAPVQVSLVEAGVPVRPAVDVSFCNRTGVQAALAWLRLATAPPERLAGADVTLAARRPSRAISPRLTEWMGEQRTLSGLRRLAGRVAERDGEKVLGFVDDLELVRDRAGSGTTAVLQAVRDELGLDAAMALLDGSRRRLDRSAQGDDLRALVALGALHEDPAGFEAWLRRCLAAPGASEGVALSTIHRMKGREWPHVVLHDVSAGLLPHRLAADVEEERRVFHVGLTRASVSCHVVAGEPPSPFLAELAEAWSPGRARGRSRPSPPPAEAWSPGRARGRSRSSPPPAEAVDQARHALRAWRSAQAARQGKPAFVILHDQTIEALSSCMPTTMAALAAVKGIGPAKLEAYGDELLAVLAAARSQETSEAE